MSRYLLQTCLGSFWQNTPTLDNYNTSIVPAARVAPTTAASASACRSAPALVASLRMLHIWDTRGFSSSRHLVVPSGRGKPPAGTETSGGDLILMRASPSLKGQSGEAGRSSSAELFLRWAGLSLRTAVLSLRLSLQVAPSWAQEKGGFKFI
ncbi:hypothetical protein AAFF_G00223020 [Aldrovandia affinis]|uniref:Uncharacterized protein n=1 Tax=Aldrovandia affinis TaxID=143900 RepID=A0AAD7W487_9TELE|nr:hypothetical protein AAFF_G00223020 [Aldrovandia affinis]